MTLQPEYFDKLVSLSGDFFFLLNSGGVTVEFTSSVSKELGYEIHKLQEKNFAEIISAEDVKTWEKTLAQARSSSRPQEFQLRLKSAKNQLVPTGGRLCFLTDQQVFLVALRKSSSSEERLRQSLQKTLDHLDFC